MKKPFLIFLFSIVTTFFYGQTYHIKVLDSNTDAPIAKVHLKLGKEVFLTNNKGIAIIPIVKIKKLEASHIKYHSKNIQLNKSNKEVTLYLTEKYLKLEEVNITSKRN